MGRLHRLILRVVTHPTAAELAGLSLATAGLHQVYPPAALIFAGAALVFVAQGMEHGE